MQNILLFTLISVGLGILLTNSLVIFYLFQLRKKGYRETAFSDDRYVELKVRFETMVLTLIIVSVLIAFMGWDIRSQIVSEVTRDVSTDIENFSVQIDSSLKLINAKTASFLRETEQFQKTLSERYTNIETLLGIYVVPDIKIMGDNQRLYFKDLHPINAEKLPIFRKPPIVDVQQSGLVRDVLIIQHTKDYIELSLSSVGENVTSEKPLFVTLWIVERE